MKRKVYILLIIIHFLLGASYLQAQDSTKIYFYQNQDYGSESQFGHLNVFMSVGFSVVGPDFWGYRIGDIPFKEGWNDLYGSFAHPGQIMQYYGSYGTFFYQEFVPFVGFASYPNYIFHIMGEGMLTRKLYEYNISKGRSKFKSRLYSISTMISAQILNEIIEAPITWRGDAISDIVVNNTVGIIAFSFDGFARLFSNKNVKLLYWPGQPMIDIRDGVMYNNTETYMLRTTMGNWTKAKLGFMLGLPSSFGLGITYPINIKDNISLFTILGQTPISPSYPYHKPSVVRSVPYADRQNAPKTEPQTDIQPQSALRFTWDREGSLMTAFEIGYPKLNFTLNVYPGILKFKDFNVGTFVYAGVKYPTTFGLSLKWAPIMPGIRFNQ
jgi:hypothetical protein